LPADGVSTKVSTGAAGQGKHAVSSDIRARLDAKWTEVMGAQFGLDSYGALLDQLRA
jgi:hypothetical protein